MRNWVAKNYLKLKIYLIFQGRTNFRICDRPLKMVQFCFLVFFVIKKWLRARVWGFNLTKTCIRIKDFRLQGVCVPVRFFDFLNFSQIFKMNLNFIEFKFVNNKFHDSTKKLTTREHD